MKATNGDAKESGDAAEVDDAERDELAEDDGDVEINSIQIGDILPSIILKNEKGEDVDAATLAQDKIVVIFLIPKADTRKYCHHMYSSRSMVKLTFPFLEAGCTQQACGFRDSYPDFTALNAAVYCLSADSSAAQIKWQTKVPYFLLPHFSSARKSYPNLCIASEKPPVSAPIRSEAHLHQSAWCGG